MLVALAGGGELGRRSAAGSVDEWVVITLVIKRALLTRMLTATDMLVPRQIHQRGEHEQQR